MNILKKLLLIFVILFFESYLAKTKAMEQLRYSALPLMALCQQNFIKYATEESFDSDLLTYAFDYAQNAHLPEIEQSCLQGLYSELQQEAKSDLIQKLTREQYGSLNHYVLENSLPLKNRYIQPIKEFMQADDTKVNALVVCNDGTLIEGLEDGKIQVRNADGIKTFTGHQGPIYSIALSKDETRIVSGSLDHTVRIWDINSGNSVKLSGHTNAVVAVALSADGKKAVSGSYDKSVRVWNCQTRECINIFTDHTDYVTSVAISDDGTVVISGSHDNTIRIRNIKSESVMVGKDHPHPIFSVALSGDGQRAFSGSFDKTIRVWDCNNGRCIGVLTGHTGSVNALALLEDKKVIMSGSLDKTVRFWDCKTGQCFKKFNNHLDGVTSVALSGCETTMASTDGQSIHLYKFDLSHLNNLNLEQLLFLENNNDLLSKDSKQNPYQLPQELKDKMDENK